MIQSSATQESYYHLLGISPDCSRQELRAAYRAKARKFHPDLVGTDTQSEMVELNQAWQVLSDSESRKHYDERLEVAQLVQRPRPISARRKRWSVGLGVQMARLTRLSGRSAIQTLLTKRPLGPRAEYEAVLDDIVIALTTDVEQRARAARAAGAAPLDLAVAAVLVGIRVQADAVRRQASLECTRQLVMVAEILDRMWDVIAHELTVQLATSLGGNPAVTRSLEKFR